MDIFGIGVRLMNSVHEHARMARGTGRSYVLSDMVQAGDAVVFSNEFLMREFLHIQRKRGKSEKIKCYVVDPSLGLTGVERACRCGPKHNRFFFDHVWLEEFYAKELGEMVRRVNITASMYAKQEDGL